LAELSTDCSSSIQVEFEQVSSYKLSKLKNGGCCSGCI
jgi:hypothetical protein